MSALTSSANTSCVCCVFVWISVFSALRLESQKAMHPACVWGLAAKVPDTTNTQSKQNWRLFHGGNARLASMPGLWHCWLQTPFKTLIATIRLEKNNNVFQSCGILFPLLFFQSKPPTHYWDRYSAVWLILHVKRLISISLQVVHNSCN